MPSHQCRCGHRISYGEIPAKDEWLFLPDAEFERFKGSVDAEAVYRAMRSFLKCPSCGRLWMFWRGFDEAPQEFIPATAGGDGR